MRHATWLAATALIGLPFSNPAAADSLSSADADNAIVMAQIIAKEAVEARTKEISIGCNNVPLPTAPQGPTWQATVDETFVGRTSKYSITAWRKVCSATDQQLLLTLEPTAGPTVLFSPFAVEQGGRNYNVMPVINEANLAFSGNLSGKTTVMLQYTGSREDAYDDEQALAIKVLSLGGPTVTLNIPASGDTTPPPFVINGRQRGTFHDPAVSGQGFLFDFVEGASPALGGGWYTASPDPEKPDAHEWFTFIGPVSGDTAVVDIFLTTGQRFVQATPVTHTKVGTATIKFTSCVNGTFQYDLPTFGKTGTISIQRLTPLPPGCN